MGPFVVQQLWVMYRPCNLSWQRVSLHCSWRASDGLSSSHRVLWKRGLSRLMSADDFVRRGMAGCLWPPPSRWTQSLLLPVRGVLLMWSMQGRRFFKYPDKVHKSLERGTVHDGDADPDCISWRTGPRWLAWPLQNIIYHMSAFYCFHSVYIFYYPLM